MLFIWNLVLHVLVFYLTMGQSGSLGSDITKFFSMRSNVVARSIPWRTSLSLSARSQLSERSKSSVIRTSGSVLSWLSSFIAVLEDLSWYLQNINYINKYWHSLLSNKANNNLIFCMLIIIMPTETKKQNDKVHG